MDDKTREFYPIEGGDHVDYRRLTHHLLDALEAQINANRVAAQVMLLAILLNTLALIILVVGLLHMVYE